MNVLRRVWNNIGDDTARYQPRSLNGGTGWMVYDRKRKRFVPERKVANIDPSEKIA